MSDEPDPLTERIIGCAIEVHRHLGAGLLESAYETALCIELAKASLRFDRQRAVPLFYGDIEIGEYRPDLIVSAEVVVEVKSVLRFEPVFVAQMLTYLRITGLRRGLILNFNRSVLKAGIKRVSL
ncbi:MAG TPA: GxxExxY protein [Vicinamibacterales bacterium]|nr:GxxExxY protein [Vicinamibacterales bacterium]